MYYAFKLGIVMSLAFLLLVRIALSIQGIFFAFILNIIILVL
jgi:hypothetical protein